MHPHDCQAVSPPELLVSDKMDCSGPKNLELKCMQNRMVWYPYEGFVMLMQKSEVDDFGSLLILSTTHWCTDLKAVTECFL